MKAERPGLLDVNVLVALAWPNHLHYRLARSWFTDHRVEGWATCPLTESSFVRISSHPKIGPDPRSVVESVAWLRALRSLPGHRFLVDDVSIAGSPGFADLSPIGHRQITDAHLLTLARSNGYRLVTFDGALATLVTDLEERAALICVIG
jgi:toxin-antitoxin system PIN domain toxin